MQQPIEQLQSIIDQFLDETGPVKILEAGCGSMSRLNFGPDKHVVGIDISEKQLGRNDQLHEALLGDIQSYPLPEDAFDIVVCWDVLEHLEAPEKAIARFIHACKPGGLIILAFPNLFSVKGFVTKIAPHAVHIWYYRHLLGIADAGEDETGPFRTFLKYSATHPAIRRLARDHDAAVELFAFRQSDDMQGVRRRFASIDALMSGASWMSRVMTGGRLDLADSDCIMVLRPEKDARAGMSPGARGRVGAAVGASAP